MATMTMSLIGLYNVDNTLFDEMIMPEEVDRETLVNTILLKSGEFEVLYPNPDFMKAFIKTWSMKWNRTFVKWVEGMSVSWNPIENYDRYEDWTDKKTGGSSANGSNNMTVQGSETSKVSAYDSSTLQPSGETDNSSTTGTTISNTLTDHEDTTHEGHIHGNIGVTQASDMLRSFLDISEWNLYEHIADVFIREVCIPIY